MTWRLRVARREWKTAEPKVSHVLSSSTFCEKEQSGREYGARRWEPWGHERVGKEKKRSRARDARDKGTREEPAARNRRSPLREHKRARTYVHTRARTIQWRISAHCGRRMHPRVVYARPLVNARVRAARVFYAQESLRGHAADRRLNHASYFTSGRGLAHAYFSISIYHPRVFHRRWCTRGSINAVWRSGAWIVKFLRHIWKTYLPACVINSELLHFCERIERNPWVAREVSPWMRMHRMALDCAVPFSRS